MVRIDHAANYFMPLVNSSKPYVRTHCAIVIVLLFAVLSMSYRFVGKPIDEPYHPFLPNAQDYFRACLLGILSPMLYYFVQTFLINLNGKCFIINFLLDFYLNDWFILLIIICLAYPQQQQEEVKQDPLWHIVPRQTYIFGITWSLGELIVSVLGNLFVFREIPPEVGSSQDSLLGNGNTNAINGDDITLSKCLDVRRDSSSISNNVYYSENEAHQKGYGSMSDGVSTGPVLLVDPNDNSLKFTSFESERDTKFLDQRGQWGSLIGISESIETADGRPIKNFKPIETNCALFKSLGIMVVAILSNVMLIVGQCLITSIYFTYVPGYDQFFTPVVNYFGQRRLTFFLAVILLPFTIINLAVNALIYACKDLDEGFYPESKDWDYYDYYNSELSLQTSTPTTASWVPPISLILSDPSLQQRDNIQTHEPRLFHLVKKAIRIWHRIAKKDSFILSSMAIWGSTVFIIGCFATIP